MSTHAWYASFTTAVTKAQTVSKDHLAGSVQYDEADDVVFTGMPFMSIMQVISHWRITPGTCLYSRLFCMNEDCRNGPLTTSSISSNWYTCVILQFHHIMTAA
jgi:hypothetical protein